jgi:hypothetical protein
MDYVFVVSLILAIIFLATSLCLRDAPKAANCFLAFVFCLVIVLCSGFLLALHFCIHHLSIIVR